MLPWLALRILSEKSAVMVVLSFTDNLRLQSHMQADSAAQSHCSLKLSMKRGPPRQLTFCHRMLVVSLGIIHLLFPLLLLPHFPELHISCCGGPLAPPKENKG